MGQVEKMFLFNMLSVAKYQAGKGIATKLMKKSIDCAIESGFHFLTSETTGVASTKIFSKLGFQSVKMICYDDYVNKKDDKIFEGVNPPHVGCTVWIKRV